VSQHSDLPVIGTNDPVSNVLKWILLAVAVLSFALLGWAIKPAVQSYLVGDGRLALKA
jgi:hypothetical protein